MNKKRFIAKVLLLAMLVQYTSGPVLAYADNEKVLQEESSIEENITDDETEETDKVEAEGNILKGEKADNTTAQIIESGNLGPDETYAPWTLDNAGVLRMYTGKMGENNNRKWSVHEAKIKKIIVGVKKDTDNEDKKLKFEAWIAGYFNGLSSVESIEFKDIDTTDVIDMSYMFTRNKNLKAIEGLYKFNTKNVKKMNWMFSDMDSLERIDISSFETYNVEDFEGMFYGLKNITELDLDRFSLINGNILNMLNGLDNLNKLTLGYNTRLDGAGLKEYKSDKYTGAWINSLHNTRFNSSSSLMQEYKDLYAGRYTLEIQKYDINFDANEGKLIGGDKENVEYGKKVTEPAETTLVKKPTRDNYIFEGWTKTKNGEDYFNFEEETITKSITLYAKWKGVEQNVIFNSNGGTEVATQEIEYDKFAIKPENPTRDNYIFEGWTKTKNGEDYFNFEEENIKEPITLFAKWKPEEKIVNFDANGGTEVDPQNIKYDELVAKPKNPTRDNYIFEGWTKTKNGKDYFNFEEETIKEPITLFAKWKGENQTVIFNSNDGTEVATQEIEYDKFAIKPENPTRDGYDFIGWYTDEALTGEYNFDNPVNFDITLFAKWEEKRLSKAVIIANGEEYTDVLTGTVLANEKKASILLVNQNSISEDIMKEIKRINPTEIIISGGEHSVSKEVENKLKDYEIIRISGKDRYETAKNIGEKVREISPNKTEAMLVDGTNFPDVITMSTIASEKRIPILLHNPENVEESKKNINDMEINNIIIGGGENSVSKDMEDSLKSDKIITRYGGSDRYETASIVGNAYRSMAGVSNNLILVDGTNFPDGITVNSLASKIKAPILLTKPNSLPEITAEDINSWKATNTIIAGGEDSVSKNIYNKVNASERISGKDRYETAVKISQKYLE